MKACCYCNKQIEDHINWCSWECNIEAAKKAGGKVHCPNGLPIGCMDRDGNMFECEHGDHPDYKFPVYVDYLGEKDPEDFVSSREEHALIYNDNYIAITLFECNYAMWHLRDGSFMGGVSQLNGIKGCLWDNQYKLSEKSIKDIRRGSYQIIIDDECSDYCCTNCLQDLCDCKCYDAM